MRIHHFYPRTKNLGDDIVKSGIDRLIRDIVPDATFQHFNVNSRGQDSIDYGLTRRTIERANREADVVIVGGSNLYEGSFGWDWGVHVELDALTKLRVPLWLVGIGTGSNFLSPPHKPSRRAKTAIRALNNVATFSGVRDVLTRDWLHSLGVGNAELMGDPATFLFNRPPSARRDGHIMISIPPRRFWSNKSHFWKVFGRGRAMFRAIASLVRVLRTAGREVVITCNDPADLRLGQKLFGDSIVCPRTIDEYFSLLSQSRAVVTARLHTAVAAFSLGIPFILVDVDQRTRGFIETYQLDDWSISASEDSFANGLEERVNRLLSDDLQPSWEASVAKRDLMHARATALLRRAVEG